MKLIDLNGSLWKLRKANGSKLKLIKAPWKL